MTIKVLVNGAAGKMGRAMSAGIIGEEDMRLVAAVDMQCVGYDVGLLAGQGALGVLVGLSLALLVI